MACIRTSSRSLTPRPPMRRKPLSNGKGRHSSDRPTSGLGARRAASIQGFDGYAVVFPPSPIPLTCFGYFNPHRNNPARKPCTYRRPVRASRKRRRCNQLHHDPTLALDGRARRSATPPRHMAGRLAAAPSVGAGGVRDHRRPNLPRANPDLKFSINAPHPLTFPGSLLLRGGPTNEKREPKWRHLDAWLQDVSHRH
jgi:hypothetical protein